MIRWNPDAEDLFTQHCEELRAALLATGADPDEVFADWRALIETRAAQNGETAVAVTRVQSEITGFAAVLGDVTAPPPAAPPPSPSPDYQRPFMSWFRRGITVLLWLLGVALPIGTLGFEWLAGFCAEAFFDPLPTWLHIALIALVPVANAWTLLALAGRCRWRPATHILNGMAIGTAAFYALRFAVLTPFAIIAIVYFGIGLIPLAPLCALWAAIILRSRARRYAKEKRAAPPPPVWRAALPAFLLLLLLLLPQLAVIRYVPAIENPDPATRLRAVRILRAIGDTDFLLQRCYRSTENMDPFTLLAIGSFREGIRQFSRENARVAYYRVTGTPFNAVPPPRIRGFRGQTLMSDDWFDPALGSDQVAARIKNLALFQSRLDGRVETADGIAYLEWTLEFRNAATIEREARALIALPPGAVVSRVTLWINDEPREAAFGGRSQTRQAYQQVAVRQRRDPVLVTTAGDDRILLQCFPVPPDGTIKTRIGISAPLLIPDATQAEAFLRLPALIEQNFGVAANTPTTVWLESDAAPTSASEGLTATATDNRIAIRGKLPADSSAPAASLRLPMALPHPPHIATDQRLHNEQTVLQTLRLPSQPPTTPPALALVLDGSARMAPHAATIRALLDAIPPDTLLYFVRAGDLPTATAGRPAARDLRFFGGCDNAPALALAADWATRHNHAPILWIHAAQPLLAADLESLRQIADFARGQLQIHSLQLGPGADRISEKMADLRVIHPLPIADASPRAILDTLSGKAATWHRVLIPAAAAPAAAPDGSSHIVRLWAADEIARLSAPYRKADPADAIALARDFQLVTPVSGAVVLETAAQYAAHNLTPAADATTPGIVPEPATLTLLLLGAASLLATRRQRR